MMTLMTGPIMERIRLTQVFVDDYDDHDDHDDHDDLDDRAYHGDNQAYTGLH